MEHRDFITLAIHTSDKALEVKRLLESHGIDVLLEKFIVSGSNIVAGISVKIHESDLPLSLKLTESMMASPYTDFSRIVSGNDGVLLIPVDFKPYSKLAIRMGFELAKHLSLHPVILHAFATPYFTGNFTFEEDLDSGAEPSLEQEFTDIQISNDLRKESKLKMRDLRKKIEKEQSDGILPSIPFSTTINEGVAEDVIKEYCRNTPPTLVVMATRAKQKKGEELVGSVTAEVLDSCRVPIFSIPENGHFEKPDKIKKMVFFCNLDQHDIITVDTLMRMLDYPEVNVTLIPINEKDDKDVKRKMDSLKDYFNKSFPDAHFTTQVFPSKTFLADFNNYEVQAGIEMIIVPNRRRNIFARLLNPGIAHKLLFERDLPLLAIPV